MGLSDKITKLSQELNQRQKAQTARAILQNCRAVIQETNREIQAIADSGNFNILDVEFKNALVDTWDVIKAADIALKAPVSVELLDWSP